MGKGLSFVLRIAYCVLSRNTQYPKIVSGPDDAQSCYFRRFAMEIGGSKQTQ